MLIGADVHHDGVHAVAMRGSEVVATASREGTDLAPVLEQLCQIAPIAREVRTVTVSRSVNEAGLVTPSRLSPISVIRINPAGRSEVPPLADWPAELREVLDIVSVVVVTSFTEEAVLYNMVHVQDIEHGVRVLHW